MDNLFGTPPSGAGQNNPPQSNPLVTNPPQDDKILTSLTELKENLGAFSTRIDDMDARLNEIKGSVTAPVQTQPSAWKPKTWDEIPQKAEEIASQVVDEKFEEQRAAEEEKRQEESKQNQVIDNYLNKQVTDLEAAGAIPKVVNQNDPNDPGIAARREVFGLAAKLGTMDLIKVEENLDMLHKSGYAYDPKANGMVGGYQRVGSSGTNAPVAVPGRSAGTHNSGMPSYDTIHKAKSYESLKNAAGME